MEFNYDSNEIHHEVASDESIELLMDIHNPNNNQGANMPSENQQWRTQKRQSKHPQAQDESLQQCQQPNPSESDLQESYPKYQLNFQKFQPKLTPGEKKSYANLFGKKERSLRKITDFVPSEEEDHHQEDHHQQKQKQNLDHRMTNFRNPYQDQVNQEKMLAQQAYMNHTFQDQRKEKYMRLMANHFASVPSFVEAALESNSTQTKKKMSKKEMRKLLPPPPGKRQRRPKLYTTKFDDELDNERFYKNSESYFQNPARHTQFLNMNFINREQHEQWDKMDLSTPDITISQRQAQIQFSHLQPQIPSKQVQFLSTQPAQTLTKFQQSQQELSKYNPIQYKPSIAPSQTPSSQFRSITPSTQRQTQPSVQRQIPPQIQSFQQQQPYSQQQQQRQQQQLQCSQYPLQQQQQLPLPSRSSVQSQTRPQQQTPTTQMQISSHPQFTNQQEGQHEIPISDDGEDVDVEEEDFNDEDDQENQQQPQMENIIVHPIVQKRKELQQAEPGRKTPGGRLTITYPDGSTRPFGKSFKSGACQFADPAKRNQYRREFVYYGGRTNGPTEHKIRKREEEKQGLSRVNPVQFNIPMPLEENRYWIPIKALTDIPPTFYMPDRFTAQTGVLQVNEQIIKTPYDAFKLFFDDDLYQKIINYTKRKLSINSLQLDAYFAAQIYSGMLSLKDESLISTKVSHLLDRQNYEQIRRCLRVSNEKKDRKVRELVNHLNNNFKKYYAPEEFLTVQASQETREYLVFDAVKMYTMEVKLLLEEPNEFEIACALVDEYKGKNHKLVMDQFYSSPQLYSKLKQLKLGAVGTIKNEKTMLPQSEIKDIHFSKIYPPSRDYASYISIDNNNILVYFIGSNEKESAIISSFMDISKNYQLQAKIQDKVSPYQTQPFMVYLYNKFKNSMEKRNALIPKSKQGKWWRQALDRLLETALVNAAILLKSLNKEKSSKKGWMKNFRRTLMQQLQSRYREWLISVNPMQRKRFEYKQHTLIEGELQVNCVECGVETKSMCQECTVAHDKLIGVCKLNEQECVKFHVVWNSGKATEHNFEHLKTSNIKGRRSTWATIKQLREYKTQLEAENDKIQKGTNGYAKAIQLLNETLAKLADQDPQMVN